MGTSSATYGVISSATITTNDATVIPTTRAIYVGVAGNVKVTYSNGVTDTLTNLAAGIWHPMQVKVIWQNGTTATDVHAGY